jgi:hypothetical protein
MFDRHDHGHPKITGVLNLMLFFKLFLALN